MSTMYTTHMATLIYKLMPNTWKRLAAAIIIIVTLTALGYIWHSKPVKPKELFTQEHPLTMLKIGDDPFLTLHDNTIISLGQSAKTVTDDAVSVEWNGHDRLSYTMNVGRITDKAGSAAHLNLLSSSINRSVQVKLADGSIIELDSSSAISYPAGQFRNEMTVNLVIGSAKFHISPDSLKLYRVQHGDIAVYTKSGRFRVSAFPQSQQVRAELEDGVIEIRNRNYKILLLAGQQAVIGNEGPATVSTTPVSLHLPVASFKFYRDDFAATVRKIEKWFGVKVIYNQVPPGIYTGHFNNTVPFKHILTAIGNNFRVIMQLEGKTVKVFKIH